MYQVLLHRHATQFSIYCPAVNYIIVLMFSFELTFLLSIRSVWETNAFNLWVCGKVNLDFVFDSGYYVPGHLAFKFTFSLIFFRSFRGHLYLCHFSLFLPVSWDFRDCQNYCKQNMIYMQWWAQLLKIVMITLL
jgi:hypothetical protein